MSLACDPPSTCDPAPTAADDLAEFRNRFFARCPVAQGYTLEQLSNLTDADVAAIIRELYPGLSRIDRLISTIRGTNAQAAQLRAKPIPVHPFALSAHHNSSVVPFSSKRVTVKPLASAADDCSSDGYAHGGTSSSSFLPPRRTLSELLASRRPLSSWYSRPIYPRPWHTEEDFEQNQILQPEFASEADCATTLQITVYPDVAGGSKLSINLHAVRKLAHCKRVVGDIERSSARDGSCVLRVQGEPATVASFLRIAKKRRIFVIRPETDVVDHSGDMDLVFTLRCRPGHGPDELNRLYIFHITRMQTIKTFGARNNKQNEAAAEADSASSTPCTNQRPLPTTLLVM